MLERAEHAFDRAFGYERPLNETFRYAHSVQHGTPEQCAALRVQAIQEQQAAQQRQAGQQAAEQPAVATGQRPAVPAPAPAPPPAVPVKQPRPPLLPAVEQAPAPKKQRPQGPRR